MVLFAIENDGMKDGLFDKFLLFRITKMATCILDWYFDYLQK